MNKKIFLLLVSAIIVLIVMTGCNSSYNKQLKEYEALFQETVDLIDPSSISKSINDNNLTEPVEELDYMINNMASEIPKSKITDFMILIETHGILVEVVKKGTNWEQLDELDKFTIKHSIKALKSN